MFESCLDSHALVAEQADVRVLETRAARRESSILSEGTIKCIGGQVLKSLGRNPKERELKSPPMLQMAFEQVRSLRQSEKLENMVQLHEKPLLYFRSRK